MQPPLFVRYLENLGFIPDTQGLPLPQDVAEFEARRMRDSSSLMAQIDSGSSFSFAANAAGSAATRYFADTICERRSVQDIDAINMGIDIKVLKASDSFTAKLVKAEFDRPIVSVRETIQKIEAAKEAFIYRLASILDLPPDTVKNALPCASSFEETNTTFAEELGKAAEAIHERCKAARSNAVGYER